MQKYTLLTKNCYICDAAKIPFKNDMIRNFPCKRHVDCSLCPKAAEGTLIYKKHSQGHHDPAEKCTQNFMMFILHGELLINSQEHPGTTIHEGQFILQAIGSKFEILALTDVEYIMYWFNELPHICEDRYRKVIENIEEPTVYTPLQFNNRITNFLFELRDYLNEDIACGQFVNIKASELVFILLCYYSKSQLGEFFFPISTYTESFHFFVMRNYEKVKNVEEFAHLGGYSVTSFRRLFRNMYGMPVYEWILNKKREGILEDLKYTKTRIGDISQRYGFESMSHFAHFCKASFGDTPRSLRNRAAKGEKIGIIKETQEKQV